MERILELLNRWLGKLYIPCAIPADKQAHTISGLILFGVLWFFLGPLWAIHALIAAALAKEIYDYFHPYTHSCEVMDIVATTIIPCMIVGAALLSG